MNRLTQLPIVAGLWMVVLAGSGCGSESELVFADWRLPVPEGVPVKEYAAVPIEERSDDTVQLVDQLLLGADITQPEALVYEPGSIVATPDGTIFVEDGGTVDIKVFDAHGNYVKTLGNEGQGPREFGRISYMTIAGERLVIYDSRNRRFSLWTLEGEYIGERAPERREFYGFVNGLADGTVVALTSEFDPEGGNSMSIVHRSTGGDDLGTLLKQELPDSEPLDRSNPRGSMQMVIDSMNDPRLGLTVASQETVLISPLLDYQVLAMTPSGETEWALRVAWRREPYNDYGRNRLVESFASGFLQSDELTADMMDWPFPYPALSTLSTDGAGRLHVFPAVQPVSEEPPSPVPVDVYSPAGDFITAGMIPHVWRYGQGEHVYGVSRDANDELVAVRYRLVVNGR